MRSVLVDRDMPTRSVGLRIPYLIHRAAGRRVLHLGCLDLPTTRAAVEAGEWLHGRLRSTADAILGVDLAAAPPPEVEGHFAEHEYAQCDVTDAEALARHVRRFRPDLVVFSEVIEHLPNPGGALEALAAAGLEPDTRVLITTPNAFGFRRNALALAGRRERTHPDHVLLFSPYTLAHLAETSGLEVLELATYEVESRRLASGIDTVLRRVAPGALPGLVLECSPSSG